VLVALFAMAQLSGVVSSPLASAANLAHAAMHAHHQQMHHQGDGGTLDHHAHRSDRPDHCCALHTYFPGVLPVIAVVESAHIVAQRLAPKLTDGGCGIEPARLDRPPRPFALI
jgi:hypothetical protein